MWQVSKGALYDGAEALQSPRTGQATGKIREARIARPRRLAARARVPNPAHPEGDQQKSRRRNLGSTRGRLFCRYPSIHERGALSEDEADAHFEAVDGARVALLEGRGDGAVVKVDRLGRGNGVEERLHVVTDAQLNALERIIPE